MTKLVVQVLSAVLLIGALGANLSQAIEGDHFMWHEVCRQAINDHMKNEMYASMVYSYMSYWFDRPSVGLKGYAKFFREQAQEEFEHFHKFGDLVTLRDGSLEGVEIDRVVKSEWKSAKDALIDAEKLEQHVFGSIKHIHNLADTQCQDAYLTSWLEDNMFGPQIESINQIRTMLAKLESNAKNINDATGQLLQYHEDVHGLEEL